MSWRRSLGKLAKRGGLVLLSLLVAFGAALVWLSGSASGRNVLLGALLPRIDAEIPGRIDVRELAQLGFSGVRLRGIRVFDPEAREVLRLEELAVELSFRELLRGRIVIPSLSLRSGLVDLRQLGEPRRGLAAAFVDPDAPASPPSSEPPPYVRVDRLVVRELDVRAPNAGPLGQVNVRGIALVASYELSTTSAARIQRFDARFERDGKPLAKLDSLRLDLARETSPSRLELALTLPEQARLSLAATLVAPPEASFRRQPVTAKLDVNKLSGRALATLLQNPALETAFSGSVSALLDASGTLEHLRLALALDTAGGRIGIVTALSDFERVALTLDCKDLRLERLRAGLPARRLSLSLTAHADAKDPQRIPLRVEVGASRIDDTALPGVTLASTLSPVAATDSELVVVDGKSKVEVRGDAQFTGALALKLTAAVDRATLHKWNRFGGGRVDASGDVRASVTLGLDAQRKLDIDGKVTLKDLRVREARVASAEVRVRASGELERPVGTVSVRLERAVIGAHSVRRLELEASGGPVRYRSELDADFGDMTASLAIDVERGTDRVELEAAGHGMLRGEPWKLAVQRTTLTTDGAVATEGIALELSGQGVRGRGSFSSRGGELLLETGTLELAKFSNLLGLSEPLRGSAELAARLSGTPAVPNLELTLTGRGLSLGERPPVDLTLSAALSAERGEASAELAVSAPKKPNGQRPLDLTLRILHEFEPGPGFARKVVDGRLAAELELERVESDWVSAWAKLAPLPVSGALRGSVHAEGTRSAPVLTARVEADTLVQGVALKPSLRLDYQTGTAKLEFAVDDARGRWLDLAGKLAFGAEPPTLAELMRRLPNLPSDETWSLALVLGERTLTELPGLTRSEIPAVAGATLVLEHQAFAEPTGSLRAAVRPSEKSAFSRDQRCQASAARVELGGELAAGRLRLTLAALAREKELFTSVVEAELALLPVLAGKALELRGVHGELSAKRLELATLPLVCGIARGTIDATVLIDDPLGARPKLSAEVTAKTFSLGSIETVDAKLQALVTHELLRADLELSAKEGRSTAAVELPLALANGRGSIDKRAPLELDVRIRRLPLAPFLNPKGAISYASGWIDGSVRARGELFAPSVTGEIVLKDVAFTATDLAQPVRRVRGRFAFTENRLRIVDFEAHDRDGVLALDGEARLSEGRQVNAALHVVAKKFPIRQQGQVVATAEIEAKVQALLAAGRSEVTIDLGAVDMWIESLDTRTGIALQAHPEFIVDGQAPERKGASEETESDERLGESSPSKAPDKAAVSQRKTQPGGSGETTASPGALTLLKLNANERIWIKRDDFAVKLAANLTTEIQGDAARVTGTVSLLRGYLTLMGKDFEIQKGSVLTFIGSPSPNPALEITAVHLNRRSGDAVSVLITGRAYKPVLTFKVDDKVVSAGEAFQAIYGSQQSNQDPKGADSQAVSFVSGLTAGLLATTARRELGAAAPIIMIEPGSQTGSGRVRAGFEFDSLVPKFLENAITGVYVEGIVEKESAEESGQGDARTEAGVLVEFYFPKNFFTAGAYGPGPTWSMDVGWQL